MLAATWLTLDELLRRIARTKQLTSQPFGVNFVLQFSVEEKVELALELGVGVISTAWGDPRPIVRQTSAAGAVLMHSCGSVADARRAADAGVDAVIAQGWESGGHVLGTTASMALIPAVVDAVAPIPVAAAGGMADGRGLAAALVLGAQAAVFGTRFLTATEAFTHDTYRARLLSASPDDAVYTLAFDGGWPGAPHRALRNRTMVDWDDAGRPPSPNRPGEGEIVAIDSEGHEHLRYEDLMPLAGMTGDLDEMALYAGQSAGLVNDVLPAAEIVARIVSEAEQALAAR
jgi:NAD(P)H-dependent flavin oxidoreductase YrpB (nitropropane dioxygenase family)